MKKNFTKATSDRGLISKIRKEFQKLKIQIPANPIKIWGTDLNRKFSAEESQMAWKTVKEMGNILSHQGNADRIDTEIQNIYNIYVGGDAQ